MVDRAWHLVEAALNEVGGVDENGDLYITRRGIVAGFGGALVLGIVAGLSDRRKTRNWGAELREKYGDDCDEDEEPP